LSFTAIHATGDRPSVGLLAGKRAFSGKLLPILLPLGRRFAIFLPVLQPEKQDTPRPVRFLTNGCPPSQHAEQSFDAAQTCLPALCIGLFRGDLQVVLRFYQFPPPEQRPGEGETRAGIAETDRQDSPRGLLVPLVLSKLLLDLPEKRSRARPAQNAGRPQDP